MGCYKRKPESIDRIAYGRWNAIKGKWIQTKRKINKLKMELTEWQVLLGMHELVPLAASHRHLTAGETMNHHMPNYTGTLIPL